MKIQTFIFLLTANLIVSTSLKADDSQCLNVDSAKTYTVMSCDGSEKMAINFCVTEKDLDTVNIFATLVSRPKKDSAPRYEFNQVPYEAAKFGVDHKRERNISDGSGCRMFLSIKDNDDDQIYKDNDNDVTYSFSEQHAIEKKLYQALRVKIGTNQDDSFVVHSKIIPCKNN